MIKANLKPKSAVGKLLAELTRMLGPLILGCLFMWLVLLWTNIVDWSWQAWTGLATGIAIGAVAR